MEGTIYAFRNKLNGKYYVGQTNDVKRRRSKHFKAASGCWLFNRAMLKYGREAFEFIILESGIQSREELNALEIKHIAETKAYTKGYNLTPGGSEHGEEQDKRIAESSKARWAAMTEEQRLSISEKCSLKACEQHGKNRNEVIKSKLDKINKAEKRKKELQIKREIIKANRKCIDERKRKRLDTIANINEFMAQNKKATLTDLSKIFNVDRSFIIKYCDKNLSSIIRSNFHNKKRNGEVICIETNQIYECAYKACKKLGLNDGLMSLHLSGKAPSVRGYHFRYAS